MSSYNFADYADHVTVTTSETRDLPDPDRTFLGLLHRELNAATEREKETRGALSKMQAKADACTREREAIERAIKAYQQPPGAKAVKAQHEHQWGHKRDGIRECADPNCLEMQGEL
jgi:hypothetical protein